MIYVMSDIHGEYERYLAMLEKIGFGDEDTLFVLGDVIDRGPEPIKTLWDMSLRPNVYPVLGNHEYMALDVLRALMAEITEENYRTGITAEVMQKLFLWQREGGHVTLEQFRRLAAEDRFALLDYLEEFERYQVTEVGETTYILVHAGLGNYAEGKRLSAYTTEELCFMRPTTEQWYYDRSVRVIAGHTPTISLNGEARILHSGNLSLIDCGATFGGKLACLCLDDGREFYI